MPTPGPAFQETYPIIHPPTAGEVKAYIDSLEIGARATELIAAYPEETRVEGKNEVQQGLQPFPIEFILDQKGFFDSILLAQGHDSPTADDDVRRRQLTGRYLVTAQNKDKLDEPAQVTIVRSNIIRPSEPS